MKYTCPCCGYKTLTAFRSYDICTICFWEDDAVQSDDPDFEGGANRASLRQAQQNFIGFGACEKECINSARKPTKEDVKDPNWKPF